MPSRPRVEGVSCQQERRRAIGRPSSTREAIHAREGSQIASHRLRQRRGRSGPEAASAGIRFEAKHGEGKNQSGSLRVAKDPALPLEEGERGRFLSHEGHQAPPAPQEEGQEH
ncbi:hypothetical protein ZIOFF_068746 [Zingiber officinale]|uniref:Uncharacterized protein n=1 Tax=Zingiber officinale TaxID=94328 RepID=A0A8J5EPE4_ZINOF|nr:hypothetical protein ZIOFF_068746 [Zingiber officinale]